MRWQVGRRAAWGVGLFALGLAGCAETQFVVDRTKVATAPEEQPIAYKIGKPYQVNGVWYYPAVNYDYDETGIASWYGPGFDGKPTANGETYRMNELTAAHQTLPLPSLVRVTNLENGRSLKLKVNDRGPFAHGRIIDVSRRAAQLLGFEQQGTARVRVQILADESRAIAALAQGQQVAALEAGESVPQAAPRTAVVAEALPGSAAPAPQPAAVAAPAPRAAAAAPLEPTEEVSLVPVGPTQLFIQAGAFSEINNAYRLQAKLSQFGPTTLTPVQVDGQQFFRVRLGPVASVPEADRLLERVVRAGHPEARLIVVD